MRRIVLAARGGDSDAMRDLGLSPTEIAARLGRTVRSVHGLHYRGRAAARLALNELGSAPATVTTLAPRRWRSQTPMHTLSA